MKLCFVVQRYGLEVNGGAEVLCRLIAEHLSRYHDIDVVTTCAKDYITWKNEYAPGKQKVNGIPVYRFPVDSPRDIDRFNRSSEKVIWGDHTIGDEHKWMKLQGPYSTKLLNFVENNREKYDSFVFFTYLYCTTFFGLPLVKDKAILVPTAHDEPAIYLSIFEPLFRLPKAIIYSTDNEKSFVESKFRIESILNEVIGSGIESPQQMDANNFIRKYQVEDFIIYVGRIDEGKGCKELFKYFIRYKNEMKSNIKLILLGKNVMKIPKRSDIISLGFVSEQDKFNGIKASRLLILPSMYESLSMVIMEAWVCDIPVLVNGNCDVVRGHCIKSNGGLYYTNYDEFKECLNLLLGNSQLRAQLGENGRRYVEENYSWDVVIGKYLRLFDRLKNKET